VVCEFEPVAEALPLEAVAVLLVELLVLCVLDALVLPDEPEPLLPPPAALVVPLLLLVLLLPFWPVALLEPVLEDAVPLLLTLVVLVEDWLAELVPPLVEPPVVVLPLPLWLTVLEDVLPVEEALPLELLPLEVLDELELEVLLAVVPAASAWPLTSMAMTAVAVPARATVFFRARALPSEGGAALGIGLIRGTDCSFRVVA
jgi:hypothetical protein